MTASTEQGAAASATEVRFPDFFIVGHAKCGTTALYEILRRHPQVFMPDVKEPFYFSSDRFLTLAQYLELFSAARADQCMGEASTTYLWSPTAAASIADMQPAARIIAIIREPASFLRSLHLQTLRNGSEVERDLRKALALEGARREGRSIPSTARVPRALIYSDRVRYVEQLRRYRDAFSPQQMLVLIYDDFRRDNEGTLRRVLRFLGVDDTVPMQALNANETTSVRSVRLDELTRALYAGRGPVSAAVKSTVRRMTSADIRRRVLYPMRKRIVYGDPPTVDVQLMLELRRRFKGEVLALSEYLERDLVALWGYGDVD